MHTQHGPYNIRFKQARARWACRASALPSPQKRHRRRWLPAAVASTSIARRRLLLGQPLSRRRLAFSLSHIIAATAVARSALPANSIKTTWRRFFFITQSHNGQRRQQGSGWCDEGRKKYLHTRTTTRKTYGEHWLQICEDVHHVNAGFLSHFVKCL